MREITPSELQEFYRDTLNRCGIHHLNSDDGTIEHQIFEEFDIGVVSFLHPDSLKKLYEANLISETKMAKSVQLRNKVMALQNSDEWTPEAVRRSESWREILELADEIKALE